MSDSEASKKVESLTLENFTVFENATFDFCPGINVLIGENSTGKTHVLKSIYSFLKSFSKFGRLDEATEKLFANKINVTDLRNIQEITFILTELGVIFNADIRDMIRHMKTENGTVDNNYLRLSVTTSGQNSFFILTTSSEFLDKYHIDTFKISPVATSLCYLPADEFLSKNNGFISSYERSEIQYSEVYYDLALLLNALPLRTEHLADVQPILDKLQTLIAGENWTQSNFIKQENGHFYFELPEGKLDVHLIADGYRKFGTLWYLLRNGSITKNSILFLDEPETSLNPKLIRELVKVLQKLAAIGVQIFIATHDYLLSYELSLLNEYPTADPVDIKFFSLHKPSRNAGVVVESAKTLNEIAHNPILKAYSAHYDHEAELFYKAGTS